VFLSQNVFIPVATFVRLPDNRRVRAGSHSHFLTWGCNFFLKKMSFLSELQPEIIIFIEIVTSFNIPGGSLEKAPNFLILITRKEDFYWIFLSYL